jgi:hypothetical protein
VQCDAITEGARVDAASASARRIDKHHVDGPAFEPSLQHRRNHRSLFDWSINDMFNFDRQINIAAAQRIIKTRSKQANGRCGAKKFAHGSHDRSNLAL